MKYFLISLFFFQLSTNHAIGQTKLNLDLSKKIDSLFVMDQKWRKLFLTMTEKEKADTLYKNHLELNWKISDSLNLIEAKKIIKEYGYPGYDLVGRESSNNFWFFIQHADGEVRFQESCLIMMKDQVDKQNANGKYYAYLIDRVKVNRHEKQVYGTQLWQNKDKTSFVIPEVVNPEALEERRKSVGLEPMAEYIKSMNEIYKSQLNNK